MRESRIRRAVDAAFSRGSGYEPIPLGRMFDAGAVRGYYIDYSAKTNDPRAGDALLPTPLIQQALGWWERHLAGDPAALDSFLRACEAIDARADRRDGELRWPVRVPAAKYGLRPPWCSALPQAQAASVFVRAHLATGQARWREAALGAVRSLIEERSELVAGTGDGPILEEAPSDPPSHILNGWISALWGLWDVHLGLDDAAAGRMFDDSLRCLLARLDAYDTGWWTRYGLYPHALDDLAKPIYHRQHVDQMEVLHRLTGNAAFATTGERWASYDRPLNRALAVAQKAPFSALEAPRRRRWLRSLGYT